MEYEWDDGKNRTNLAKHGLSFEDTELVFSGPCVTFEDDRFDLGQLGRTHGCNRPRAARTRIISMRKANRHERKIYQERPGAN